MLKLGRFGERRDIVRFKDWRNQPLERIKGRYPVLWILLPQKYPSGALMWEAEVNGKPALVKLTVKAEKLAEIIKALGLITGMDMAGKRIWFVVSEDGEYGLDIEEGADTVFKWRGTGWKAYGAEEYEEEEAEAEVDM